LKLQLADRMRLRFEAVANADIERKGMNAWDGESLPERVATPGGEAYPALVDEGKSVGVRAFTCPVEAAESHRAGGARLLVIAHAEQAAHLRKKFPLGMMAKVELPRLGAGGTSLEDLILLSAEGAAGVVFPRSPDEFRALTEKTRGRLYEAASHIGKSIDQSLELLPETQRWISRHLNDRNLGPIAEDLNEQLVWLLRSRFAWRAGFSRILDYPRHLTAIRSRLGRVASLPLIKDLEKLERFRRHWEPWFREWTAAPEEPRWWDFGWQLEEYRVSLFAPDVPIAGKVSEKRLEASWAELMENHSL
jgi:ATP-dependent helicase HrpA